MASMEAADWNKEESYLSIVTAGSPEELKRRRTACQQVLLEQLGVIPVQEWMHRVNAMHDQLARTAVRICEAQMKEAGYGLPPAPIPLLFSGVRAGRKLHCGAIRITA